MKTNKRMLKLVLSAALLLILFGSWLMLKEHNDQAALESSVEAEGEEVFTVDTSKLTSIAYTIGDQKVTFSKADGSWTADSDSSLAIDESKLLSSISGLSSIKSLRTLTEADDISQYGLNDPQNVIYIKDEEGTMTTIVIGDENSETGNDYVMVGDSKDVYTVSSSLLSNLASDLEDLEVEETTAEETTEEDTTLEDTTVGETGTEEKSAEETGAAETTAWETTAEKSGAENTTAEESSAE